MTTNNMNIMILFIALFSGFNHLHATESLSYDAKPCSNQKTCIYNSRGVNKVSKDVKHVSLNWRNISLKGETARLHHSSYSTISSFWSPQETI